MRIPLLLAVLLGLSACMPPAGDGKATGNLYWPTPPDQPRFMYEAVLRNSASVQRESDMRIQRMLTGDAEGDKLLKPLAVAARSGRIYVSDTEARRVSVFDLPRRKLFHFGTRFEGELRKPGGIAVDGKDRVYVADITQRRVVVFDGLGLFVRLIGEDQDLVRPTSVAVNRAGTRIYVVDAGGVESEGHRVIAFDQDGRKLFILGPRGSEPGRFNLPTDAAVAADGTLYVLDSGNFRVQAFDADGKFLHAFGAVGSAPGQFARPRGLAVGPDGNLYVSDGVFNNVQVFTPRGELLVALGARSPVDAPGQYRLVAGIAVDETQRVYVVDQYFRKVEVIKRLSEEEGQRALPSAR